jgi:hypothetical protein
MHDIHRALLARLTARAARATCTLRCWGRRAVEYLEGSIENASEAEMRAFAVLVRKERPDLQRASTDHG